MHLSTPFIPVVASASARLHLIQSAPAATASRISAPRLSTKTVTPFFCRSPINFFHQPLGQPVAELPATTHQSPDFRFRIQYSRIFLHSIDPTFRSSVKKSILSIPSRTHAHPCLSPAPALGSDPGSVPKIEEEETDTEIAGIPHCCS